MHLQTSASSSSNWPPWRIRHCTLASHLTCPNCYNIMNPHTTLLSSSSFQLSVPRYNLEFGSHAFRISAPKIWNLLPASIRNSPSLPTFCRHHIIFSQPILTHNNHPLSMCPLHKSFTYLLTYLLVCTVNK